MQLFLLGLLLGEVELLQALVAERFQLGIRMLGLLDHALLRLLVGLRNFHPLLALVPGGSAADSLHSEKRVKDIGTYLDAYSAKFFA